MMTNLLRFDFNDRDGIFEVVENGDWVRATDYDALAAKLAEVEASSQGWIDAAVKQQVRRKRAEARLLEVEAELAEAERVARYETDIAQQALDQMRAAEAALPAAYRLALGDAEFACTNVIKNYDVTYDGGKKFAPMKTQNAAKGMVSIAREDICALPTPAAAELMARIQKGEE